MATKVNWAKCLKEQEKEEELVNRISEVQLPNSATEDESRSGAGNSSWHDGPGRLSPAKVNLLQTTIRHLLVASRNVLNIQRQEPNSPIYSIKTFNELHLSENLLGGIEKMGYVYPSKIQETVIPEVLADPPRNLIVQSQSGTGKTTASVLAMLNRVDPTKNYPQVLCLSPTYELAIQIGELAAHLSMYCPEITIRFALKGEIMPQEGKLNDHIIIGTPGKVLDWVMNYEAFSLDLITLFVLDEADVMLDKQRHQKQCIDIHRWLNRNCQMVFFSSTYDQEVIEFAKNIVQNPIIKRLKREEELLDNIHQFCVKCETDRIKYDVVTSIYKTVGIDQILIFCRSRSIANWLAGKMSKDGYGSVAVLTGDLTVEQRIDVLDKFTARQAKVLITQNILSRGIDVEKVTVVVNYDLPIDENGEPDYKTYLHRIGRTGRFGKKGIAINLIDRPKSMQTLKAIEKHYKKNIEFLID